VVLVVVVKEQFFLQEVLMKLVLQILAVVLVEQLQEIREKQVVPESL